jgi:hypothetical protein
MQEIGNRVFALCADLEEAPIVKRPSQSRSNCGSPDAARQYSEGLSWRCWPLTARQPGARPSLSALANSDGAG